MVKANSREVRQLWYDLNVNKFKCPICNIRCARKNVWLRHCDTQKHFLLTTFRNQCPRDLKILTASFLPLASILELGSVGLLALDTNMRHNFTYNKRKSIVISSEGPHARTAYVRGRTADTWRILPLVI